MTTDYSFRPDLKELARRDFLKAQRMEQALTPKAIMRARMESAVSQRTGTVRRKLQQHLEKHKGAWVAREEKKLQRTNALRQSLSRSGGPKPPFGVAYSQRANAEAVSQRARSNVERRCESRLRKVDQIERRMMRQHSRTRSRSRS